MEHRHRVFRELALGVVWLAGTVRGSDLIQALEGLYTDPEWEAGFETLWDARGLRDVGIEAGDVEAFVGRSASLAVEQGRGRIAIVVTEEVHEHVARLLLLRRAEYAREGRIFYALSSALEWLGIDHAPPELVE